MNPSSTPAKPEDKKTSESAAIIEVAKESMAAQARLAQVSDEHGTSLLFTSGNMMLRDDVMERFEKHAPRPKRAKGLSQHLDQASFVKHINRHKVASSVIFADPTALKLTAIYNYNDPSVSQVHLLEASDLKVASTSEEALPSIGGGAVGPTDKPGAPLRPAHTGPNWGDHRSLYECPKSPEWLIWSKAHNQLMSGEQFAELIEDNTKDIVADKDEQGNDMPTAAQLLKMALDLKIDTRKVVGKKINPVTGECSLNYTEDHQEGSTKIPAAFAIGIPVFLNSSSRMKLICKVRLRMEGSTPKFGFLIPDLERAALQAFKDVCKAVETDTSLPLFVGKPE